MSQAGCRIHFLIRCIQLSVTDVIDNGSGKQVSILQHDSKGTAQIILFNLCNINAVVTNLTFLNIIETVNQVGNGSFSSSCRAYKCKLLSRLCIETDVL